jgi:hypothetical protein
MTVQGSVFIGSCKHKKQIMLGIVGDNQSAAVMSVSQALKVAAHIRSTCRNVCRWEGSDDESNI